MDNELEKRIDDIVLKPASWKFDDYKKSKQQILDLITQEKEAMLDRLEVKVVEYSTVKEKEPRLYGFIPVDAVPLEAIQEERGRLQ